jgi:hypothetical protein
VAVTVRGIHSSAERGRLSFTQSWLVGCSPDWRQPQAADPISSRLRWQDDAICPVDFRAGAA